MQDDHYHIPVLLHKSVEGLNIHPDGCYIDATFGGGGHSREILSKLSNKGMLYGFDQDPDAEKNIITNSSFTFVRSNFRFLQNWIRYYHINGVDGILADLGVSSHHFDDQDRGFSFRFPSKLDMRMNKRSGMTATDILNTYEEEKLANIFYLYGELTNSRKIAQLIVKRREDKEIKGSEDFIEILNPIIGKERKKKELAKIFQALRIEVNQEMSALEDLLKATCDVLKPNGRLVVLTYHSLEDRMVKNFMKAGNIEGKIEKDFFGNIKSPFRLINNKVIIPSDTELQQNPRSRSAKLRIAEKL